MKNMRLVNIPFNNINNKDNNMGERGERIILSYVRFLCLFLERTIICYYDDGDRRVVHGCWGLNNLSYFWLACFLDGDGEDDNDDVLFCLYKSRALLGCYGFL